MHDQLEASCRGDVAAALAAFTRRPLSEGQPMTHALGLLDRLGDRAPDWMLARWACDTAYCWMMEQSDPRLDRTAKTVAATYELPPPHATPEDISHWLTAVAINDDTARQFALFDLGGLADFVDLRAEPELLRRAPRLAEWAPRPWSVFEQTELRGDTLRLRDTVTDDAYDVLHLGAANGNARDSVLFGRVVPTTESPGWVFVHRPQSVDPQTADRLVSVLRSGEPSIERIAECLADGVVGQRLPVGPGSRLHTWLWSDTLLLDEDYAAASMVDGRTFTEEDRDEDLNLMVRALEQRHPESGTKRAPRHTELRRLGVPAEVAEAILTCECALLIAMLNRDGSIDGGGELAAVNAASNLWYPPFVDGVREHATQPHTGPLWRMVAACVAEPFRATCLEFAEVAERKAAA